MKTIMAASSNSHGDICCLCLSPESMKLKSLNSSDIIKNIEKYLCISVTFTSKDICCNCYYSIESFHEFYLRVHDVRKKMLNLGCIVRNKLKPSSVTASVTPRSPQWDVDTKLMIVDSDEASCLADSVKTESEEVENNNRYEMNTEPTSTKDDFKTVKKRNIKCISGDDEQKMAEFYNLKCEKCGLQFTNFNVLNKHYLNIHKMKGYIKCCKRNIRVFDKSYLRNHMMQHLYPDLCKCSICGKELSSLVTLKHHMILHKPTEQRPFQCQQCGNKFCCRSDLKNHETNLHSSTDSPNEYICDVCGKVFQKVRNLRYHLSTVHLKRRKFICEVCARTFTTHSGFRTHMNAAHSSVGQVQCLQCNKWLKNSDTLHRHSQLHKKTVKHSCGHCSKVCNSASSLRSHMIRHSEARPHVCSVCSKSFKTSSHLRTHSVQHSGGSQIVCPFCHKTFVNMSNYYTHRKRMHPPDGEDLKTDVPTDCRSLGTHHYDDVGIVM